MAFDAYIKFAGPEVQGSAILSKGNRGGVDYPIGLPSKIPMKVVQATPENWIQMDEYGFSATMAVTAARSGGTGAPTTGKGKLEPFTFKKPVDRVSMSLAFHASAGTVFKEILVNVFVSIGDQGGAGSAPVRFLTIGLRNAVITSCGFSGGGGDDLPTEDVSISYGAITYELTPFVVEEDTVKQDKNQYYCDWNTVTNTGTKVG